MAKVCSECKGRKVVVEVVPCRGCGGSGIIPGTPPKPCPRVCDHGQVETGNLVTCTNCQGSGYEPEIDW